MKVVTIGLTTCNRNDLLYKALYSLQNAKIPQDYIFNLVVCDNNDSRETKQLVTRFKFEFPHKYIVEKRRGIPFARNAIVEKALSNNSEYLIFFDDDEVVDSHWLVELLAFQSQYRPDVTIGPAFSLYPSYVPEMIKKIGFFEQKKFSSGRKMMYAATSNIIYDMRVFRELGLRYDERFALSGGTDNYLAAQIINLGGNILYCAEAIVYEDVASNRAKMSWISNRTYRVNSNDVIYYNFLYDSKSKAVLKVLIKIIKHFVRLFELLFQFLISFEIKFLIQFWLTIVAIAGLFGGILGFRYNEYKKEHSARI